MRSILISLVIISSYLFSETINGYELPPEPDPVVNNTTLLGIDSNNNGVRDDVERYIVKTYRGHHKIATEIGFQLARAYNTVIKNPENAKETYKVLDAAIDCDGYFNVHADRFDDPIIVKGRIGTKKFKSMILNTRERIKAYLIYDRALSGGVYTSLPARERKNQCDFNVEMMLKNKRMN